tara:strand:+ start:750 stop:1124 length:375 start_codon:yes stop_codon:yes gene_type:complete
MNLNENDVIDYLEERPAEDEGVGYNLVRKQGRPVGATNLKTYKTYKWDVTVFDKDTNTFKRDKCVSVSDINEKFGLNLNSDYVKRIRTKYRADMDMKKKGSSFLARWGHVQIEKIYEPTGISNC